MKELLTLARELIDEVRMLRIDIKDLRKAIDAHKPPQSFSYSIPQVTSVASGALNSTLTYIPNAAAGNYTTYSFGPYKIHDPAPDEPEDDGNS